MNSFSDINNSFHPHSLNFQSISLDHYKKRVKNPKSTIKKNLLNEYQRNKGDYKYIEKYIHKYFLSFYKNSKNDYNIRMIEDILNNESTHLVAEFKDYLIMGDITEFLQKSYTIEESKKYLPKIYDYYNSSSVIFPNYVILHESKYIYKNIRKKQKVIDNQQEQEEKKEKIKKGEIKNSENEKDFLTTKTFYSILNQTNTSNIKLFFGINDKVDKIDINETPNNIIEKLKNGEKQAFKKKIQLNKNNSKSKLNIKGRNITLNNINNTNNINNSNINKINNSKIWKKNKSKERNKNNNNIHYLTHIQKKTFHKKNNSNINIKRTLNEQKRNKIKINNYLTKNDSRKYFKSNSSIKDSGNDINRKKNYITFYGNNLMNSKNNEIKKIIYSKTNNNKYNNIFINTRNNSNKNIKKKIINSLLPSKNILSRLFSNYNNSAVTHNSYINKIVIPNHITEDIKKINKQVTISPSTITIQVNSFRKKYKNNIKKNINLKESKSTRNIINNKLNINNKSKEKINLKNIHKKINRNYNLVDYNSNTLPISTNQKSKSIKTIFKNTNPKNVKLDNNSCKIKNNTRNNNNINSLNNTNNNSKLIYKNMQKINSTSNIKNPMNMNININTNNNSKKTIFLNERTCSNITDNKLFSKSPFNIELETIKVTKRKRIVYPKKKIYSDISKKSNSNLNNQNIKHNTANNNNKNINTISKDKNYYLDSLVHTSSNSNNINEELNNNGFGYISTINYINTKKDYILEEPHKKKNTTMPYKKEINNINININGYNIHGSGSLTSRNSKNASKKKNNKKNNIKEINFINNYNKIINNNNKQNNLMKENPFRNTKIYENIKNNKSLNTNKSLGIPNKKK